MESGTRLGPYEILQPLGAGGMGEVWLAQDSRLGRKVAIKILPPEFAADSERLARFEQEARAAAALNHPNIAAVHDVGVQEDLHYMVQEYLQGSTLAERLSAGPIPMHEALVLGREIAEALVAAHAAGIVHRDLKPDNVFITRAGHAKVLDFGLAKLVESAAGAGADATMSPTMVGTMAGAVMGTAGYMAPEQVQGLEVDRRTDLFAFGSLLYEMLTGERAFAGRTVHHTLDLILSEAPGSASDGGAQLPDALRWVLDKCLAKPPARRYQDADDLVVDLERLAEAAAAGTLELPRPVAAAPEPSRRVWLPWLVTGAIALVLAVLLWNGFGDTAVPPRPVRFAITVPGSLPRILLESGAGVAVAPDGSAVVLGGRDGTGTRQLWRRRLDSVEIEAIPGTAGAGTIAYASDSRSIAYFKAGKIHAVDLEAGVATTLGAVGSGVRGIDWGPDGWIVVGHSDNVAPTSGLQRVDATGGGVEVLVEPPESEPGSSYRFPVFLPGGREILFTIEEASSGSTSEKKLAIYSLDEGTIDVLPIRGTHARYTSSGHLLFVRRGDLVGVPFDIATRSVIGTEAVIARQIESNPDRGEAQFAVSAAGVLAYGVQESNLVSLVRIDRTGAVTALPGQKRGYKFPQVSPDGRRVAVSVTADGSNDIWIYELVRQTFERFTFDGQSDVAIWGADGASLIYQSYSRDGAWETIRSPIESASIQEIVEFGGGVSERYIQLHPDGETLLFTHLGDVWVAPPGENARALFETAAVEKWATFSPDGTWIAYLSREQGRDRVYVTPYPGPGRRWLVSEAGGSEPRWSRDGRELLFRKGGSLLAVTFDAQREPPLGTPIELFHIERMAFGEGGEPAYDVDADGGFVALLRADVQEPGQIFVVTRLADELSRVAPTER